MIFRAATIGLIAMVVAFCLGILAGCGGGGGDDAPPAPEHFLLVMETTAHQPEAIYVYDTSADCVAAGSYRVLAYPDKFIGYACKET